MKVTPLTLVLGQTGSKPGDGTQCSAVIVAPILSNVFAIIDVP